MMAPGEWYHPLIVEKIVKQTANAISMIFCKCYQNPLETFFESLVTLGACHVTIIGGVVYKKSMIFLGVLWISQRVLDIFPWDLLW